jgi:hypothetical protein
MSAGRASPSPKVVTLTLCSWIAVVAWSLWSIPRVIPVGVARPVAIALAWLYLPWMATWLWMIHNFIHQAMCTVTRRPLASSPCEASAPVALLYTTCDDFDPIACLSGLKQNHRHTRLIICDDSRHQSSRDLIDEWVERAGPHVSIVRRPNRDGLKAGNLNYAIETTVTEELIAICDADEVIPEDFVTRLAREIDSQQSAFVQCRHTARHPGRTWFEDALGPAVDVFYRFTIRLRARFGFVACFGHGMMLRRSAWKSIGGFPQIACEDLGFAMVAASAGLRGGFVDEPSGSETFPPTYSALASKYRRIVAGTVECFQQFGVSLLRSPHVSMVEKLDFVLTFSICYLPLVMMINVFGAIVLAWFQAASGHPQSLRWVLVLYLVGPLTPVVPLIRQLPSNPLRVVRFAMVATIAYGSLTPILAFTSVAQTVRPRPVKFVPTGVVSRKRQRIADHLWTAAVGIAIASLAVGLRSIVFAPSFAVGLIFLVGPILTQVDRGGLVGWAARRALLAPHLTLAVFILLYASR